MDVYDQDVYSKIQAGVYKVDSDKFSWGLSDADKQLFKTRLNDLDETPLTVSGRASSLEELEKEKKELEKERRAEYSAEQGRLYNLFRQDVEYELDFGDWPDAVKQAIHSKAWDDGHSGGLGDVYAQYDELVDLVTVARDHP